jgi:hypothetical protein
MSHTFPCPLRLDHPGHAGRIGRAGARRVLRAWVALCGGLLIGGCGTGDNAGRNAAADTSSVIAAHTPDRAAADTAAHGPRACDLLTGADFARVTGVPFEPGTTVNDYMGSSQCRLRRPGAPSSGAMVALHLHGDLDNYRNVPGSLVVGALGDGAIWNPNTGQLAVKKGDAVFSISLFEPKARRDWQIQLAKLALKRLK